METNELVKALRKEVAANPCAGLCSACDISECMTRLQIQAADRIEKQDAEIKALRDKVPDWISVEEQLPDTNKSASGYEQVTVIATDGKRVRPMIYERACVRGKTQYRWKWIWDKIYDGNPITYWMPLPELPEEEKHEK